MGWIQTRLRENLEASIRAKEQLLSNGDQVAVFQQAVDRIIQTYQGGGRLYIAGNGGSAADAQHLATEFVAKLARPRAPLPAEALTVDTSLLTAIGNDFGFDQIFSRQIEGKMTSRDIFLGITTSGDSPNIILALATCRRLGIPSVLLTGRQGGRARELADFCILAPGQSTSAIQETHMVLYHTLCGCVEEAMFPLVAEAPGLRREAEATIQP